MKGKSYTQEFKEQIFKEVEEVKNIPIVAKKHGLPYSTIHTWLRKRGKKIDFTKKVNKSIETSESRKLKKIISEKDAEISILRELLKKTYQVWEID